MISIKINICDLKINYIKKGEGKTVLILPGWGASTDTYMPIIQAVSHYANVFCIDFPGFGGSEEPKESLKLDDYVAIVQEFVKKQEIKELDLIGHSNGGRVIIKLMSQKDLGFKVNKIILIGSAGIVHEKKTSQKIKIKIYKGVKRVLERKPFKRIFSGMIEKMKNHVGSTDYRNASPVMKKTLVNLVNEDLRELLPNIKVPTLLIWGTKDTETPVEDAELMEKQIPDAGLVKIENGFHYVFLENSPYVNKIIETFLKGGN